jgi:hypothetical protein
MPVIPKPDASPVTNALGAYLPDWLKNNIPSWLKPSPEGIQPNIADIASMSGPLEAPAALGMTLLKSSPAKALAQRLIKTGGNAVKGTSLEEAIHFLASRAPRTLSHISEITTEPLTSAADAMMGQATLGGFLPHAHPINSQIGSIMVDDIVPHMDAPDAVGILAHETTHAGQYLRAADRMKGRDWAAMGSPLDASAYSTLKRKNTIDPRKWTDRISGKYLKEQEKYGYFWQPKEAEARIAEHNNILRFGQEPGFSEMAEPALSTGDRMEQAIRAASDPNQDYTMGAIQRALARMAQGGGIK